MPKHYVELNQNNWWQPATGEEKARAEAVRKGRMEEQCTALPLSSLPRAFHGFLDPNKGLGDIPDPKYASILDEQPGQCGQLAGA